MKLLENVLMEIMAMVLREKKKLEKEGYCYKCVQTLVNSFIGKPYKISHEDYGHCLEGYCEEAAKILSV